MWLSLTLTLLLSTALLALYLVRRSRGRRAQNNKAEAEPPPGAQWKLRELIEGNAELQSLYEKLGYSARLDRESGQIIAELKAAIRTEIPDFAAFTHALQKIDTQARPQTAAQTQFPDAQEEHWRASNDELLSAVLAVGSDQASILQLLNRNPVDEQLPFIEQIPINKNGALIWRTPLEHSLIRKRPTDPVRFAALLDQLEGLFKTARTPRGKQLQREVVESLARARRDLQKETGYLPTALQVLEKKLGEYIRQAPSPAAQTRIRQLDALLEALIALWNQAAGHPAAAGEEIAAFRRTAQQQAKAYLDAPWMHTPWLQARVLATLLDAELAALSPAAPTQPASPATVLRVVRDEVASGSYDNDETIRRLRQQETHGLFVNSLVYPLLRPHYAPQTSVNKAAT